MKKSLKRNLSSVLAATMMTSSMVVANIGAVTVSAAS